MIPLLLLISLAICMYLFIAGLTYRFFEYANSVNNSWPNPDLDSKDYGSPYYKCPYVVLLYTFWPLWWPVYLVAMVAYTSAVTVPKWVVAIIKRVAKKVTRSKIPPARGIYNPRMDD